MMNTSKLEIIFLAIVIMLTCIVVSIFSVSMKNVHYGIDTLVLQPPYDKKDLEVIDYNNQSTGKLLLPDGFIEVIYKKENFELVYTKYSENGIQKGNPIDLGIKIETKEDKETESPYHTGRAIIESQLISWEGKLYPVVKQTVFHSTYDLRDGIPDQTVMQEVTLSVFDLESQTVINNFKVNFQALPTLTSSNKDNLPVASSTTDNPLFRDKDIPHSFSIGSDQYRLQYSGEERPYTNLINGLFVYQIFGNETTATLYNPLDGKIIDQLAIDKKVPVNILSGSKNGILFTKRQGDDKSIYQTILHSKEDPIKVKKSLDTQYVEKISSIEGATKIVYYSSFGIYAVVSGEAINNSYPQTTNTRTYVYNMDTRTILMDISGDYDVTPDSESSNVDLPPIGTMSPNEKNLIIGDLYINIESRRVFTSKYFSETNIKMEYVDNTGFVYGVLPGKGYVKLDTRNNGIQLIDTGASVSQRPYYINSYNQAIYVLSGPRGSYLVIAKPHYKSPE